VGALPDNPPPQDESTDSDQNEETGLMNNAPTGEAARPRTSGRTSAQRGSAQATPETVRSAEKPKGAKETSFFWGSAATLGGASLAALVWYNYPSDEAPPGVQVYRHLVENSSNAKLVHARACAELVVQCFGPPGLEKFPAKDRLTEQIGYAKAAGGDDAAKFWTLYTESKDDAQRGKCATAAASETLKRDAVAKAREGEITAFLDTEGVKNRPESSKPTKDGLKTALEEIFTGCQAYLTEGAGPIDQDQTAAQKAAAVAAQKEAEAKAAQQAAEASALSMVDAAHVACRQLVADCCDSGYQVSIASPPSPFTGWAAAKFQISCAQDESTSRLFAETYKWPSGSIPTEGTAMKTQAEKCARATVAATSAVGLVDSTIKTNYGKAKAGATEPGGELAFVEACRGTVDASPSTDLCRARASSAVVTADMNAAVSEAVTKCETLVQECCGTSSVSETKILRVDSERAARQVACGRSNDAQAVTGFEEGFIPNITPPADWAVQKRECGTAADGLKELRVITDSGFLDNVISTNKLVTAAGRANDANFQSRLSYVETCVSSYRDSTNTQCLSKWYGARVKCAAVVQRCYDADYEVEAAFTQWAWVHRQLSCANPKSKSAAQNLDRFKSMFKPQTQVPNQMAECWSANTEALVTVNKIAEVSVLSPSPLRQFVDSCRGVLNPAPDTFCTDSDQGSTLADVAARGGSSDEDAEVTLARLVSDTKQLCVRLAQNCCGDAATGHELFPSRLAKRQIGCIRSSAEEAKDEFLYGFGVVPKAPERQRELCSAALKEGEGKPVMTDHVLWDSIESHHTEVSRKSPADNLPTKSDLEYVRACRLSYIRHEAACTPHGLDEMLAFCKKVTEQCLDPNVSDDQPIFEYPELTNFQIKCAQEPKSRWDFFEQTYFKDSPGRETTVTQEQMKKCKDAANPDQGRVAFEKLKKSPMFNKESGVAAPTRLDVENCYNAVVQNDVLTNPRINRVSMQSGFFPAAALRKLLKPPVDGDKREMGLTQENIVAVFQLADASAEYGRRLSTHEITRAYIDKMCEGSRVMHHWLKLTDTHPAPPKPVFEFALAEEKDEFVKEAGDGLAVCAIGRWAENMLHQHGFESATETPFSSSAAEAEMKRFEEVGGFKVSTEGTEGVRDNLVKVGASIRTYVQAWRDLVRDIVVDKGSEFIEEVTGKMGKSFAEVGKRVRCKALENHYLAWQPLKETSGSLCPGRSGDGLAFPVMAKYLWLSDSSVFPAKLFCDLLDDGSELYLHHALQLYDLAQAHCGLDWVETQLKPHEGLQLLEVVQQVESDTGYRFSPSVMGVIVKWARREAGVQALNRVRNALKKLMAQICAPKEPGRGQKQFIETLLISLRHDDAPNTEAAKAVADLIEMCRKSPSDFQSPPN